MPASYSLDLRIRIAHDFNDNGNAEQVALSYNVSLSSVFKFARLYRENDLAPKSTDPKRLPLILDGQLDDLRTLVKEFSDYKLTQYCLGCLDLGWDAPRCKGTLEDLTQSKRF